MGNFPETFVPNMKGLLWSTRGARNPNLQVLITHVSHVCSQHSFGLLLRMYGMHRTHFDHACLDVLSYTRILITRVLTYCHGHVKRTQSTALKQKRFDLRSLSPTLPNLWLLLVYWNEGYVTYSE